MSREKRFCYILILVFYILFTIIQGIAVVYPVDWITINSIKITEETDITFEISKKLKRFKKPIDYFIK